MDNGRIPACRNSPICLLRSAQMARMAVDVVLLPECTIMDLAIAANAELLTEAGGKIMLGRDNCIPHISLAMGCIAREDIARVGKLLKPLSAIAPRRLKLTGIQRTTNLSGEVVSSLGIGRSAPIQDFHEKVCETVKPFFSCDVAEDMVAGGRASESTLGWIRSYFSESGYANFSPHITIGYGELRDRPLPADFAVSCVAMCHLGNHCTCARILWSVKV